jgi:hypothetical protein
MTRQCIGPSRRVFTPRYLCFLLYTSASSPPRRFVCFARFVVQSLRVIPFPVEDYTQSRRRVTHSHLTAGRSALGYLDM